MFIPSPLYGLFSVALLQSCLKSKHRHGRQLVASLEEAVSDDIRREGLNRYDTVVIVIHNNNWICTVQVPVWRWAQCTMHKTTNKPTAYHTTKNYKQQHTDDTTLNVNKVHEWTKIRNWELSRGFWGIMKSLKEVGFKAGLERFKFGKGQRIPDGGAGKGERESAKFLLSDACVMHFFWNIFVLSENCSLPRQEELIALDYPASIPWQPFHFKKKFKNLKLISFLL